MKRGASDRGDTGVKGLLLIGSYGLAIAAVVLLQIPPATGVVLMLFLAIVWAAILFNLMLAHVGYWAAVGRIERFWLALPILVYGGWAAASGASYLEAREWRRSIDAANERVQSLSGADRSFIVTGPNDRLARSTAVQFASIFKSSTIHQHGRVFALSREHCGLASEWKIEQDVNGRCIVSKPESAPAAAIAIEVRPLSDTGRLAHLSSGRVLRISRVAGGGTSAPIGEIRQAALGVIMPFPVFLAGCALNDARGWDCVWGIGRTTVAAGHSPDFAKDRDDPDDATFVAEWLGIPHW